MSHWVRKAASVDVRPVRASLIRRNLLDAVVAHACFVNLQTLNPVYTIQPVVKPVVKLI